MFAQFVLTERENVAVVCGGVSVCLFECACVSLCTKEGLPVEMRGIISGPYSIKYKERSNVNE